MLKSNIMSDKEGNRRDPNLFDAARDNDMSQMKAAIASGSRFDDRDPGNKFTPLHTAALNGSTEFILEALRHPTADPWLRDAGGHLAIDHADACNDQNSARALYAAMYPQGRAPLPNEP